MRRYPALPLAVALLVSCLACNDSSPTEPSLRVNLRVAIENSVTRARIPDVTVTVQERGSNRSSLIREHRTSTGNDGIFRVDDLQPGWFGVELSKPGFRNVTVEITEDAGERLRTLDLVPE